MTDIIPTSNDREVIAKFKPRARLLLQLGDQLIKNESIALLELAKNAYDADASIVSIVMVNPDSLEKGCIEIEDDGFGMTLDIVENVWLEPGSSYKQEQFAERRITPKFHRLPIGEKGIGRFGAHKLGDIIEMTTKSANANEVYVRIDWTQFAEHRYLEDVPIKIVERKYPAYFKNGNTGTRIVIHGFRKEWERGMARSVLRAITSISSPFAPYILYSENPCISVLQFVLFLHNEVCLQHYLFLSPQDSPTRRILNGTGSACSDGRQHFPIGQEQPLCSYCSSIQTEVRSLTEFFPVHPLSVL